jgi:2-keto-4-pentenoate hydratase
MTTPFDPARAAALLADAMTSGTFITEIPEAQRPRTIAEGYDVQDHLAVELTNADALRDTTAGWKLGLGSVNAMNGAGIDRPLMGRVFQGRLHDNDVVVAAPDGATVLIEIELAVTLSRDIAPSDQVTNPLDAVASANLVSEIVLSRFVDRTIVGLPSVAADSVGFHALVIGPEIDLGQAVDISASLAVTVDGEHACGGLTGDDAVDPASMMAYLMAHARERGITLRKGEIITTGAMNKPFDAVVPCAVEARTQAGTVRYRLG